MMLGADVWTRIAGKSVIDFGCGMGEEAVELARQLAVRRGVSGKCEFNTLTGRSAVVIVSIDAFEHFDDPPRFSGRWREC